MHRLRHAAAQVARRRIDAGRCVAETPLRRAAACRAPIVLGMQQYRTRSKSDNRIGLHRRCVVFTGIPPNGPHLTAVAEVLATALRTRFLAPKSDGLATGDGGHCNSRSAELWSAAFVEALTPIVNECLGQLVGSSG